jgi:hypothetical protein
MTEHVKLARAESVLEIAVARWVYRLDLPVSTTYFVPGNAPPGFVWAMTNLPFPSTGAGFRGRTTPWRSWMSSRSQHSGASGSPLATNNRSPNHQTNSSRVCDEHIRIGCES